MFYILSIRDLKRLTLIVSWVITLIGCSSSTFEMEVKKKLTQKFSHDDIEVYWVNGSFYRFRFYNYPLDSSNVENHFSEMNVVADFVKSNFDLSEMKSKRFEVELTESDNPNLPNKLLLSLEYSIEK